MDLTFIDEIMSQDTAGVSELGLRRIDEFYKGSPRSLKKDKVELGKSGKRLYALELQLPFNPKDLSDNRFSYERPFLIPFSPTTSVLWLKKLMREDSALHAHCAKIGGMKPEEYDVSEDVLTEEDKQVFTRYRRLLHYSMPVQHFRFSGLGPYGRKILSQTKFDEFGQPIEKDLGYELYEFEMATTSEKVSRIEEEFGPGGVNQHKPEKDKKEAIKTAWKSRLVSEPYYVGTIRVLVFNLDMEGNMTENMETLKKKGLVAYECYSGGGRDTAKQLESILGTKYDKAFDYLEIDISYPNITEGDENERKLEAYKQRNLQSNPEPRIHQDDKFPGFEVMYREFRDNQDIFNEKVMLRSVFEYRPADDSYLLEHYKEDLADKKYLITEKIAERYSELIERIDGSLSEDIMAKLLDAEGLPEGSDIKELPEEFKASEETLGGVSPVDLGDDMEKIDELEIEAIFNTPEGEEKQEDTSASA